GRRHANVVSVKGELFWIFNEVKQVGMTAAEFLCAVDAEGVVPNYPASAAEAQVSLEDQLQFRCILIANRQPKGTSTFEDAANALAPRLCPGQIMVSFLPVVIDVIFIADIEGWIGEGKVH